MTFSIRHPKTTPTYDTVVPVRIRMQENVQLYYNISELGNGVLSLNQFKSDITMSTVGIDTFKKINVKIICSFKKKLFHRRWVGTGLWAQQAKRHQTQIAYYNRFQQVTHPQTQTVLRITVI